MRTRGAPPAKRATRHSNTPEEAEAEGLSLGNPPPLNFANGMLELEPPHTIALSLTGTWDNPPSFGGIEAALTAEGRAQHRIWRVEVGPEGAVARVHPDDVQRCVGLINQGDMQVCPKCCRPREPAPQRWRIFRLPMQRLPPRALRRCTLFVLVVRGRLCWLLRLRLTRAQNCLR